MERNKFIRCFRLVSRLQSEQLKVNRLIQERKGNIWELTKRFDDLQRRKETLERYYKTI